MAQKHHSAGHALRIGIDVRQVGIGPRLFVVHHFPGQGIGKDLKVFNSGQIALPKNLTINRATVGGMEPVADLANRRLRCLRRFWLCFAASRSGQQNEKETGRNAPAKRTSLHARLHSACETGIVLQQPLGLRSVSTAIA